MTAPPAQPDLFAPEASAVASTVVVSGPLRGLRAAASAVISYTLRAGEDEAATDRLVGARMAITWHGRIVCVACGNDTPKSFAQGHCWNCMQTLASCDRCIVSPERCHYHLGTCREPQWGEGFCMQPHIVYLANSSGLKVGITRETNVPGRWMDQGASQALPLLRVRSRYHAGLWEHAIREYVSDRTDWRAMLRGPAEPQDLPAAGKALLEKVAAREDDLPAAESLAAEVASFRYPAPTREGSIRAVNLEKQHVFGGQLLGIKGQYLLFDSAVFNVRRHAGYVVTITSEATAA